MTKLSVGYGRRTPEYDLIRLDISEAVNPDRVWNLNQNPYPFDDSSFEQIECFDVIEHLENIPSKMEEFYRILEPNGLLKITTPYFFLCKFIY